MRTRKFITVAIVVLAALAAQVSVAQTPPTRFFGTLLIDGALAPPGTEVKAFINGVECGSRLTEIEGVYYVDAAHDNTTAGCGIDEMDMDVSFTVNGYPAAEIGKFVQGVFAELNLSVTTQ